jgi:hypothetical protein
MFCESHGMVRFLLFTNSATSSAVTLGATSTHERSRLARVVIKKGNLMHTRGKSVL